MKTLFKRIAAMGLLLSAPFSYAFDWTVTPYAEVKGGYSWAEARGIKHEPSTVTQELNKSHFNDDGYLWGGSAGLKLEKVNFPIHLELEYLHRDKLSFSPPATLGSSAIIFKTKILSQTFLANGFIHYPLNSRTQLFLGAGAGVGMNYTKTNVQFSALTDKSDAYRYTFSWMLSTGLDVKATDWLTFVASYRYSDLGQVLIRGGFNDKIEDYTSRKFYANEIMMGARFF